MRKDGDADSMDKETERSVSDAALPEARDEEAKANCEPREATEMTGKDGITEDAPVLASENSSESKQKANSSRHEENNGSSAEEPPKKKRGRPRKNPPRETDSQEAPSKEEPGKEDGPVVEASGTFLTDDAGALPEDGAVKDLADEAAIFENSEGEFIIPLSDDGAVFPVFVPEEIPTVTISEPDEIESDEISDEAEDGADGDGAGEAPVAEAPVAKVRREKPEKAIGSRGIDTLFDFLELFIFTFVGVLIVTTFLFRHSVVSGSSMINTLHDEDKLIISDLFYTPDYGDIVVVEDHTAGITSPIVKRVIALEGDTVRVTYGGIWVNGEQLNESEYVFTDGIAYYYDLNDHIYFKDYVGYAFVPGEYYEFVVPEDEIYVLGDHRNDSTDSRKRGTVREDSVLGRVILRFYPFSDFKFFG